MNRTQEGKQQKRGAGRATIRQPASSSSSSISFASSGLGPRRACGVGVVWCRGRRLV